MGGRFCSHFSPYLLWRITLKKMEPTVFQMVISLLASYIKLVFSPHKDAVAVRYLIPANVKINIAEPSLSSSLVYNDDGRVPT